MRTRRLRLPLFVAASLLGAACSGSTVVIDDDLETRLVSAPEAGGPWTLQMEHGNPIDILDPVCGAVLPEARPFSIGHNGRVWFGGEPYPVLLHIVDRFESPNHAASLVSLHRTAAESCTSWTFQDERGTIEFTVRSIDAGAPDDAVALEIVARAGDETLVTRQVMYPDGDVVAFLAHISLDEPDLAVLPEMVAEATGG
jgi:hypothetical protein